MLATTAGVFRLPQTLSESFLPYNVLVTLFGAGSVAVFYGLLITVDPGPRECTVALVAFMFCRSLHYYSAHILTDVPCMFFALAALLLGLWAVRKRGWRSWAACAGAAVMILAASSVRPVGPLLLPAVIGGIWLRGGVVQDWKGRLGRSLLLLALPLAPLLAYSRWTHSVTGQTDLGEHYFRGRLEVGRLLRTSGRGLAQGWDHFGGISDALMGTDMGPAVGLVLVAVMGVGLVVSLKRYERQLSLFALLITCVIVMGGWSLGRRYLMPVIPIMYYWLAIGGVAVGGYLRSKWDFWTSSRVRKLGALCLFVLLAVNFIRIGELIKE
jgi:hypothetical protein